MFVNVKLGVPPVLTFIYQGLVAITIEVLGQLLAADVAFAHVTRLHLLRRGRRRRPSLLR